MKLVNQQLIKNTNLKPVSYTHLVCHGEDEEALRFVTDLIKEKLHPADIMVSVVGCAIGAHTGRGIIGVCFLDAPEDPYMEYLS